MCSGRGKCDPSEGGPFIGVQLLGGVAASYTYTAMMRGQTFALADNAWTVPGVGVPNGLWCQTGGMPMKNPLANGDCEGCGGWQVSDSASGTFKSTRDFMGDVTNFARAHPIYSLLACQDGIATTTNCQLCAATLFKKLTAGRLCVNPHV